MDVSVSDLQVKAVCGAWIWLFCGGAKKSEKKP